MRVCWDSVDRTRGLFDLGQGVRLQGALLQDLRELEQRHGQSTVVLRMEFKRGLHPFYPPAVRLLRPRCRAPLLGALSSHPMLRLRNWDPWRPQRDLFEQLRLFLQVQLPPGTLLLASRPADISCK